MNLELTGRIKKSTLSNGTYYTLVTTPAPDSYSMPSTYKIRSERQLGNAGEEVTLDVSMSGLVKNNSYVDKETGEQKVYENDIVIFTVQ